MKYGRLIPHCACILLALLTGCAGSRSSNYASVTVHTARVLDIRARKMVPVGAFSVHERMAAVVKNLTSHNQVLMVEFIRPESGLVIWQAPVLSEPKIPHALGPNAPLPAGNYIVRVTGTGIQPASCSFAVYGR